MSLVKPKYVGQFMDLLTDLVDNPHRLSESELAERAHRVRTVVGTFMRAPAKKGRTIAHNYMSTSDLPQMITQTADVYMNTEDYDMGWELAYKDVPVEPGRNFWEILNLENGVTFRKVAEGGRVRVEGVSGEKSVVFVDKYGGAIGWTDEEIRFRQYSSIETKAAAFRDAFWLSKANVHYRLIGATKRADNTTAYQGSGTDAQVERDIATINAAAFALANRLKSRYVRNVLAQPFILYFNPNIWARIVRALRQTSQDYAGSVNRVLYNIRPVPTFNEYLNDANGNSTDTTFALVLPGFQSQKATVMEPTSYSTFDHLTLSYVQSMWSYYGAVASAQQTQFGSLV